MRTSIPPFRAGAHRASTGTERQRRPGILPIALALTMGGGVLAACGPDAERSNPVGPAIAAQMSGPASARETASARWVSLTRNLLAGAEPSPLGTARSDALVSVAMYDAVVATDGPSSGPMHPRQAGAAAGAAAAVLRTLYPSVQAAVDAQLAADQSYFSGPSGRVDEFLDGVATGEQVAAQVVAHASSDGSSAVWSGTAPVGPGYWTSAPMVPPIGAAWGQVRPWYMTSGDEFRPPAPPAYGSGAFLSALAEVQDLSRNATPEQLQIAVFWAYGSGPGGPMGYFGSVASDLATKRHMDELAMSRLFAVLYTGMMDASVGCWDGKYAYWYVRPYQVDPTIPTPVGRPNFPSYPSAHSCFTGAAVEILSSYFPAEESWLRAMVPEAGVARIYGGLHYRFDVDAGRDLGYAVGRLALQHAPRGKQPIPLD